MTRWLRPTAVAASIVTVTILFNGLNASHAERAKAPIAAPPTATPTDAPIVPEPALPSPAPVAVNPDPENPTGRLIEVSIKRQRLTAWRDGKIVYRFVISTGRRGYETPPGHYKILEKYKNRWSRKWSVWMPYAMRFFEGYFIHQLPHKDGSTYNIGATKLGMPDSHGCVRVDVGDAKQLFEWTKVGTPVWVH
ncbi:MAG: L,D-transpeptidase family protein [Actinomycetota bacterium]